MPDIQNQVPSPDLLAPARDAVFQKLGRNIALFHQLEAGLKALYVTLVVDGFDEASAAAAQARRKRVLRSKSLGIVVDAVFDALAEVVEDDLSDERDAHATYFRIRFGSSGPGVDERRQSLKSLVKERNGLVHKLTDDFDLRTVEGIAALDAILDPQAERIRHELRSLQVAFQHQRNMRQALTELFASDDFKKKLNLDFLRGSRLITGMAELAVELARPDGWTGLSLAAQTLRNREPQAFNDLKARYGYDRLKPLLLASGLFELREEATAGGGVRVLFRRVPLIP